MLYLKNNNIYNHIEFYILVIIWILSFINKKFGLALLVSLIILFLLYFHRNFEQETINTHDYILYSPAQGKILNIEQGKIKTRITIFFSAFDNHTQCIHIQSTKVDEIFRYGSFNFAQNLEMSGYNQQLKHILKTKFGNIDIIQYTGFFTRRIYSLSSNRDKIYNVGDKLGYIRFGSRVDIDVPNNIVSKILVKKNTKISMLQPLIELK
jgi:phosphatidylserine decarboxylase